MANVLQQCFPEIRTREAVLREISESEKLWSVWMKWNDQQQKEFLDCCTGAKGVRILYDAFFKEVMNPETAPERLEELLSLILRQRIKILKVLPNDSTRIADENSLVIMDIVIELEDHSIILICFPFRFHPPPHRTLPLSPGRGSPAVRRSCETQPRSPHR